jgi:alpha-galactosidase
MKSEKPMPFLLLIRKPKFVNRFKVWIALIFISQLFAAQGDGVLAASSQSVTTAKALVREIQTAAYRIEDTNGQPITSQIRLNRKWSGNRCQSVLVNTGKEPLRIGNIILFDLARHGLDSATPVYGEGFQKLSQTGGTLAHPKPIGRYEDAKHYRIPEPDGWPTVYGMMTFDFDTGGQALLGFTSCKKFISRFSFTTNSLRVSVDPEGLELAPGESWPLEEFIALAGDDRNALLDELAADITRNHPPLPQPPLTNRVGWCTWYGVGGAGNQQIISNTVVRFKEILPALRFIQIDEGYCPALGDWLEPSAKFGDMPATLETIRAGNFLPGMWLAPFIAQPDSIVLHEHPDWFVQSTDGQPLDSSKIGFGGWSHGPWRVLDGTNPDTQKHLEEVFRTMREKWGVTYFKLDANYWGAIHGGKHFDPKATRVEAYRRGMEAIVRGAGPGAVILGCNAPIWPSFGLVNAMRTGNDVSRSRASFFNTARENFNRGWQNGKLWVNDPDCVLLADNGKKPSGVTSNLWMFHATAVHAVGGLVLTGDRIEGLQPPQLAMLRKLIPPTGKSARFENDFETGVTTLDDRQYLYAFNWSTTNADRTFRLTAKSQLTDFWTGENLGVHQGSYVVKDLPAQSARIIFVQPMR